MDEEIPFYVRMNMILIDGTEVKKNYFEICKGIIRSIENNCLMTILIPRCLKISEQINQIQTQINVPAISTDILVEVQNKTQLLKEKESKEINALFKDIIVWLSRVVMENFR